MSEKTKHFYKEFNCKECNKLMFKGVLIDSEVEIKCKRCGTMNSYRGDSKNEHICLVDNCPHRVSIDS